MTRWPLGHEEGLAVLFGSGVAFRRPSQAETGVVAIVTDQFRYDCLTLTILEVGIPAGSVGRVLTEMR